MSTSTTTDNLDLSTPYSSRHSAGDLRDRIVKYLSSGLVSHGDTFLTDAALVEKSGLSRSTVRRALEDLQRDGWIDRRIGQGTFVGPRAGAPINPDTGRRLGKRLAVLIYSLGDLAHDWYTPLILEGLDKAASELELSVELLGTRDRDTDALSQRLEQTLPDVLACLSNDPREAFVIRDAQRLGIPCIVSGTPHMRLGIPCVREDNQQAIALAVGHLVKEGHHRIALAIQRSFEPWVFERHEAFRNALEAINVDAAESSVYWLPLGPDYLLPKDRGMKLKTFLQQRGCTAVIAGSRLPMLCLEALSADGKLKIPHDISVVTFEQKSLQRTWFGGIKPDSVELPLHEIGEKIAHMAHALANREPVKTPVLLPSRLVVGDSVLKIGKT